MATQNRRARRRGTALTPAQLLEKVKMLDEDGSGAAAAVRQRRPTTTH